jgi:cell division protein FtsW (lipid II flippase)
MRQYFLDTLFTLKIFSSRFIFNAFLALFCRGLFIENIEKDLFHTIYAAGCLTLLILPLCATAEMCHCLRERWCVNLI